MKLLICTFLMLAVFCLGQNEQTFSQNDKFEFVIYPTCKKYKGNNEELKKCFEEQLWYDLNFLVGEKSLNYYANNTDKKITTVVFTIDSNGKFKDFSYTAESDAEFAKDILKRIMKTGKYYESKNKHFVPAKLNGKAIDYQINYPVNLNFSETFVE